MAKKVKKDVLVIGWREWVKLPGLGIENIKAKVDSGARSSSIHAVNIHTFYRNDEQWVRFRIHPIQRSNRGAVDGEARVIENRSVKSSNGIAQIRPVIITEIEMLGRTWDIELTLVSRDNMGFRMLLGREAFRKRFLVDGDRSFYGGKPVRSKEK